MYLKVIEMIDRIEHRPDRLAPQELVIVPQPNQSFPISASRSLVASVIAAQDQKLNQFTRVHSLE
jgi:hypothetical protein